MKKPTIIILTILNVLVSFGQKYDYSYIPREYNRAYTTGTRGNDGRPTDLYWQIRASYVLKVEVTTSPNSLKGEGFITYYNNSPDTLNAFILKILQDVQKKGYSRDFDLAPEFITDGVLIHSITVEGVKPRTVMRGSNLIVVLSRDRWLPPGGKLKIDISWTYEIPRHAIRNGAYSDSSFFIGYLYPQLAVYDDIQGWDQDSYTGRTETYNDLADYQIEIKVPEGYLVWATGKHENEEVVYSKIILDRIAKSRMSDNTISIVTPGDLSSGGLFGKEYERIWKFTAEDVPDFAFATSNYYLWDAISVGVEPGRRIWVNAVYPHGAGGFDRVAGKAGESISFFSIIFPGIPYPWGKHITYNGMVGGGMEYPMMANNAEMAVDEGNIEITAHEIAHTYLPFYTLINERRQEWLDEGWAKLMGELFAETKGYPRSSRNVLNSIGIYNQFAGSFYDTPLII
ncbi:MAG: hypothetical protein JXR67_04945 [Bacteroidales bacterium]|nr:hypothetical protein [Bacteroidales bacterium]